MVYSPAPSGAPDDAGRGAPQVVVDRARRDLTRGDGVDEQPRSQHHVAAGVDVGARGLQRLGVDLDEAPLRELDAVLGRQEVEARLLADSQDDGVARDRLARRLVELRVEAALGVEDRQALHELDTADFAVAVDDPRAERGVQAQALVLALVDLDAVRRHLLLRFEARDVYPGDPAPPGRGPGHVGGDAEVLRALVFLLLLRAAQCGAGHVEGDVPAADHDHPGADLDRFAEVRELQELEAVDDAGEVRSGMSGRRLPCRPAPMKNALKPSRRRSWSVRSGAPTGVLSLSSTPRERMASISRRTSSRGRR
jgi:hypothetical protein